MDKVVIIITVIFGICALFALWRIFVTILKFKKLEKERTEESSGKRVSEEEELITTESLLRLASEIENSDFYGDQPIGHRCGGYQVF